MAYGRARKGAGAAARLALGASFLVGFALGAGGCSSFNRDWREAAAAPPPENDITGPWVGRWEDGGEDGHSGQLRAIVTKVDDNRYHARYRATYARFLTHESDVALTGRPREGLRTSDRVEFEGEEDLGWLAGGVFTYRGYATPDEFHSDYDSKNHTGAYHMRRPDPEDQ